MTLIGLVLFGWIATTDDGLFDMPSFLKLHKTRVRKHGPDYIKYRLTGSEDPHGLCVLCSELLTVESHQICLMLIIVCSVVHDDIIHYNV